jgi:CheY-like chemotaxis protein
MGISPEMLPKIFELFAQGERTLDRSQGGLGIGLTIVRRLVQLHGGTVQAFSDGLRRGSEFVVCLPTAPAPPPTGNGQTEKREGREGWTDKPALLWRVLIVDDNRDSADSLAVLLRMLGHEAKTAYDGETALKVAEQFAPDIVLLDIGLPRLSGLETARRLRNDLGLHDSLLIAMTGYGQEEDKRRSREAGFNAHLVKPVDFGELRALLERFASQRRSATGASPHPSNPAQPGR